VEVGAKSWLLLRLTLKPIPAFIDADGLFASLALSKGTALDNSKSSLPDLDTPSLLVEPSLEPPAKDSSMFIPLLPAEPLSMSLLVSERSDFTLLRVYMRGSELGLFLQQFRLPHLVMKAQTAMIATTMAKIGKMTSLLISESSSFSWKSASSLAAAVSIFCTFIYKLAFG